MHYLKWDANIKLRIIFSDTTSVKFAAKAFLNPFWYLDTIETQYIVQKYYIVDLQGCDHAMCCHNGFVTITIPINHVLIGLLVYGIIRYEFPIHLSVYI